MTQQGAALQTYNNELVKCIEELCSKRDELNGQIQQEEEEKSRLQHDIRVLTEKLSRVNESLAQRLAARSTFDRTIAETEAAYMKVCSDGEGHAQNMGSTTNANSLVFLAALEGNNHRVEQSTTLAIVLEYPAFVFTYQMVKSILHWLLASVHFGP
uniref:Sjogren syndrome nuclear autoantigen 1 n=1 Tax=Gadus morhua TaxID=8049 RepID=A0A8C5C3J9_GADMO